MRPGRAVAAIGVAVLAATVLVASEAVHIRSSRRGMGGAARHGRHVVVVLGFGDPGPRAHFVNRYRVRAGVRSRDPRATENVLVLSGGAVAGPVPEADLMAAHARDELGVSGPILRERDSRSTWDNVRNVIPLLEDADSIAIASHSLHAEVARVYLRRLRPDLADRLVPASEQRIGEQLLLKPYAAVKGMRELRRLARQNA